MVEEYSLWFMPSGELYDKFSGIIKDLSSKYGSPPFEPHVTLLGDVTLSRDETLAKAQQIASSTNSFTINLTSVDYLDSFFQCFFIRAEKTEPLLEVQRKAREMLGLPQAEYMPHLSLMYGDLPPETKEKIRDEIGREFNVNLDINSLHVYVSSKNVPIKEWRRVKEIQF